MQSTGNQVIYSCKTFLAKSGEHYLRGARSLGRLSGIVRLSVLRSLVLKGSVAEGLLSPGMSGRVTQHSNAGDRLVTHMPRFPKSLFMFKTINRGGPEPPKERITDLLLK